MVSRWLGMREMQARRKREAEFRIDGRLVDGADEGVSKRMSTTATFPWDVADDMVAYLIKRADDLTAHADNPQAEAELERIVDLIEAYEAKRWPDGKIAAGKG
jgi:hypothetical protein